MVDSTGRPADPRRIRRLKSPAGVEVEAGTASLPARVRLNGVWCEVALVRRPWRVDQYWWRSDSVSRIYYRLAPNDGPPFTIYQDLRSGNWARQEY